jgi:sugar lactone lactonase YvrE
VALRNLRLDFERVGSERYSLAEGPLWDVQSAQLFWVDTDEGIVHILQDSGRTAKVPVGQPVGCVAVRAAGTLLVALTDGIYGVDAAGEVRLLAAVEADRPETRLNDGKCDSAGRLWVGSMIARNYGPPKNALYCFTPPGLSGSTVVSPVGISNGLGWSPDDRHFYYVDTAARRVDVFNFDADTGEIKERRPFAHVPKDVGAADGLAVDEDGCVWVAIHYTGLLHRYTPSGELDLAIAAPMQTVTSLTFGGSDLRDLYLTSASHDMTEAELAADPLAGAVMVARSPVRGLRSHRYGW